MKKFLPVLFLFVLLGAGCTKTPADNTVTYDTYNAGDTGITFDISTGTEVHENVNGFDNFWKFECDDNSYFVSYYEYSGQAIYAYWETLTDDELTITDKENNNVYSNNNSAIAEAFFAKHNPAMSIRVYGQEGKDLIGELLPNNDAQYMHLMQSIKLNGEQVF
ncbi:hypothetical protein L6260_01200 [Candidatus Parcubacteria bacterium]|nr:hypothetical protein [Patescibacteria group bacterium]MCG2687406.1 hypothetical protein [Candidatus Parcubacteria bacterium]